MLRLQNVRTTLLWPCKIETEINNLYIYLDFMSAQHSSKLFFNPSNLVVLVTLFSLSSAI